MPTYVVTDPETGVTLELTGDSPPLESELVELFAQNQPQQIGQFEAQEVTPEGGILHSIIQPTQAIIGSMGGEVAAGLSGILELVQTGDLDAAAQEVGRVRNLAQETFAPESKAGQKGLQNVMSVLQAIDENIIRPAVGGAAGVANIAARPISNITQGFAPARQTVQAVKEQGLGPAAGQQVLEATGSPALATLTEVTPSALEFATGAGTSRAAVSQARRGANLSVGEAQAAVKAAQDVKAGRVTETTQQDVLAAIQKGSEQDIADIVQADPAFYSAIDELGIDAEPLASYASQNPQFRSISGALEVIPGSTLEPQGFKFIEETAKAADRLIERYGGTTDKAQLGLDFKRQSLETIDDLYEQADEVYGNLAKTVDRTAEFSPQKTVEFLRQLDEADELTPKLKSVLRQLSPKRKAEKGRIIVDPATGARRSTGQVTTSNPKLGKIDALRKQFGQAVSKGSGIFKDQETGLNKALYARLTSDLDNISESIGGDALSLSDAGKGLVRQRKQIEDNLTKLYGRDLNQALNVNVSGAIKNLSKGEVDRFTDVVKAIPPDKRGQIVLSSMNDVFRGTGVNREAFDATQFTKWYQTISRSPAAKRALFDSLPKDSRAAIDNLFEVSRGISRALGQKRPTGVSKLLDSDVGLLRKMMGSGAVKAAVALKGGPAGSAGVNMVSDFLNQATSPAKAASDLLASDQLRSVIRQSVKEGVFEGGQASQKLLDAEKRLINSNRYKKWADSLPEEDQAALTGGFLTYLQAQEQE